MKQLTFVSAPVWVALPPVAEGWGWKWCLLLLLLAGRSTSHYCTSVKFSTTAALGYTQHTSCFNVMKGCYWYLKQIFSLLWCARSLWHQSWLRLLGQDSPHPELHSNSHWSLLQMLQVWTVASTNKKNKETFQWWKMLCQHRRLEDKNRVQQINSLLPVNRLTSIQSADNHTAQTKAAQTSRSSQPVAAQ